MARVGGEVDAFCTRCQLTLAHTVVAMVAGQPVKVRCNTCDGVHRHRAGPGARPARNGRPGGREKRAVLPFEDQLRRRDVAAAQRYSPTSTYALDQVIDHPVFGLGFVSSVRDVSKIEVTFRTEVKTLVHGKR